MKIVKNCQVIVDFSRLGISGDSIYVLMFIDKNERVNIFKLTFFLSPFLVFSGDENLFYILMIQILW